MHDRLRIALGQANLWVGDVEGNANKMLAFACRARDQWHADLVVFPELALMGYPPDDLLLRSGMPPRISAALERLRSESRGIAVLLGYPEYAADGRYNAAVVYSDGSEIGRYRKHCLPNYGVFDEKRHFQRGSDPCVCTINGVRFGVTICEDIWEAEPGRAARDAGAQVIININASPFHRGKSAERERELGERARDTGLGIIYVNCVGGQDELVFDGDSMVCDAAGQIGFRAPLFEEDLYCIECDANAALTHSPASAPAVSDAEAIYRALVQAVRDYVDRNGFPGALVGLSGGIDSALTLVIAADALGANRVHAVSMPSRYTAGMSRDDAGEEASLLGVRYDEIAIEDVFSGFLEALAPLFGDREADLSEENIQARVRGTLLMALSNKFGHLVLATGNKSEMAVGYSTLYGDMVGGFAPLKDVYKGWVYRLAQYRNTRARVIPERVITRPPSAELRAEQKDSDSLPEYDILDAIVEAYVEHSRSISDICAMGFDSELVARVARLIRRNEYKRRQAPPGPKVTRRAFGRDRRYPITAVYGDV